MTCREFIGFMADYLSGELPDSQRSTFDEHLAGCEDCVHYLDTYRESVRLGKAALGEWEDPVPEEVPGQLVSAILAAVRKPSA